MMMNIMGGGKSSEVTDSTDRVTANIDFMSILPRMEPMGQHRKHEPGPRRSSDSPRSAGTTARTAQASGEAAHTVHANPQGDSGVLGGREQHNEVSRRRVEYATRGVKARVVKSPQRGPRLRSESRRPAALEPRHEVQLLQSQPRGVRHRQVGSLETEHHDVGMTRPSVSCQV